MNTSERNGRTTSRRSKSAAGPDYVDVATMSSSLARRFAGEVVYGFSEHQTMPGAYQITVSFLVTASGEGSTGYLRQALAVVEMTIARELRLTLEAQMYRLLWELEIKLVEATGEKLDW